MRFKNSWIEYPVMAALETFTTPWHDRLAIAATQANVSDLKALLNLRGEKLNTEKDLPPEFNINYHRNHFRSSRTALMRAIESRSLECVTLLCEAGSDINLVAADGWTALGLAAALGLTEIMGELIKHGADPNKGNVKPLAAAVCGTQPHFQGSVQAILLLIFHEAKIDETDSFGHTALLYAAMGRPECIGPLLKAGAQLEAKDKLGRSALCLAARGHHEACVNILMKAGANIHSKDNRGETPLMAAIDTSACLEI